MHHVYTKLDRQEAADVVAPTAARHFMQEQHLPAAVTPVHGKRIQLNLPQLLPLTHGKKPQSTCQLSSYQNMVRTSNGNQRIHREVLLTIFLVDRVAFLTTSHNS